MSRRLRIAPDTRKRKRKKLQTLVSKVLKSNRVNLEKEGMKNVEGMILNVNRVRRSKIDRKIEKIVTGFVQ
jgi:hypothetical protein